MQLTTEKITRSRKVADRIRRAMLPRTFEIVLRLLSADLGDGDVTDLWEFCGELF